MDLSAQARQAAQQGQQMLQNDLSESNSAKGDYNNYMNLTTQANQNLQAQSDYMKGAGSGQNVYNSQLGKMESDNGWQPGQMADANKSLFAMNGALNSANNSFNTPGGVGSYGMSAGALGSYEGSILNPLQTGVANANTEVGTLNNELGTLQTGASQATTAQVQSEQNTVQALSEAVKNYQAQADSALQKMTTYADLAQKQGGMNADMQSSYAAAAKSYADATNAIAQSKLALSQTTGQNIMNQGLQNQLNAPAPAKPAPPKPNASPAAANGGLTVGQVAGQFGHDLIGNGGNMFSTIGSEFMAGLPSVLHGISGIRL